jgi:hypothetical protein
MAISGVLVAGGTLSGTHFKLENSQLFIWSGSSYSSPAVNDRLVILSAGAYYAARCAVAGTWQDSTEGTSMDWSGLSTNAITCRKLLSAGAISLVQAFESTSAFTQNGFYTYVMASGCFDGVSDNVSILANGVIVAPADYSTQNAHVFRMVKSGTTIYVRVSLESGAQTVMATLVAAQGSNATFANRGEIYVPG